MGEPLSFPTIITPRLQRSHDSSYPEFLSTLPVACLSISGGAYSTVKQGVVKEGTDGNSREKPKSTILINFSFSFEENMRFYK